jgi:6-phospho-beta-glucosidase
MKLAVIGAGSTYTPELVSGLSRWRSTSCGSTTSTLSGSRSSAGSRADARSAGYGGALELTGELDRAVEGADFVLIQIRVGGQAARFRDETVPLACGCIGQETTGAGGFAKAMRTVPVVLEIADRVGALAAPAPGSSISRIRSES